ncbi:MAG: InlB B-repeat-containing protein, partial [Candidatus Symbiothrix sp.]|nr:InlB B-repeat-containing protein [Candidatus Symbiothrix sp.]
QSISLAELIAGATAIDYADLDSEPFVAGGVLGEDNPDAKLVYDASQAPFNNGDGRYAVAYKVTVPEGNSIMVSAYAYSFVDGTFDLSSVFQIYKDGNLHIDGPGQSYNLAEAGTYTLVVAPSNSSPTMTYGLTVIKLVPIVAVTASESSIEVPIDESVVEALYNQVTLTGTKESGRTVEFHSYNWSENSTHNYVYDFNNNDLPDGCYFTDTATNTAHVTVTHPALTVDDVITLPYSQTQLFDGSAQIINGKRSVVLQFTLTERTSLKFAAKNFSDYGSLGFVLLDHNKNLCASIRLSDDYYKNLDTGTYFLVLDDYGYEGDFSAAFSIDSVSTVVYTDLDYTPITIGTPVTGSLGQLIPVVLNPSFNQKGIGYSFNATAGTNYEFVCKFTGTNYIHAAIFLLKENLTGTADAWNDDRMNYNAKSGYNEVTVILSYKATETGILRLLPLASFEGQEVSYTIQITETRPLSDLIAGAAAIDYATLLDGEITKAGTFGTGEAALMVQDYSYQQFYNGHYAAAWTVELTAGDSLKFKDIQMSNLSSPYIYWQNGTNYDVVMARYGRASFDIVAPHTGTYVIVIASEDSQIDNSYSLLIGRPIPPTVITAITPSQPSIAVNFGASTEEIRNKLSTLTLEGTTIKGPVSVVNKPNNWSINGDTATYTPTSAPESYEFTSGVVANVALNYPSGIPIVLPYHETHKFIDLPKIDDKRTYVFEFSLTRKAKVNISVNATDSDFTVLNYELFDANRSKINSERWVSSFEEPSPTHSLPAGNYYLLISELNGSNRLFDFNLTTTTVYTLAELVTDVITIDYDNLASVPFNASGVLNESDPNAKIVSDGVYPFNNGDGRYAVAYKATVPEGGRVDLNLQSTTSVFYLKIYKDGEEFYNTNVSNFNYSLTEAGTYTLVAATYSNSSSNTDYSLTVLKPVAIVAVSASEPSIEVPIGANVVDALYNQITLTGTKESGGILEFHSSNWTENGANNYVYDPDENDLPHGYYFAADVTNTAQVIITHPAFVVDSVITFPHSENLVFSLGKQVINGKRSVVWQFTLTERTRLRFVANNFSANGRLSFTLLNHNKNLEMLRDLSSGDAAEINLDADTYYIVLNGNSYSGNDEGDFRAIFSIGIVPMVAYTDLEYSPITFRTTATGSFEPLSTMVLTPERNLRGTGYSFNTIEGNRYRIVYTLSGERIGTAYLYLLNGGNLNGDAGNWNGDLVSYSSSFSGNKVSVTLAHEATETGTLRLLPLASFDGQEVSYTIEVTDMIALPALLAQADAIPYREPLSFRTNGVFTEDSPLVGINLNLGFNSPSGADPRYAAAYKIDLPEDTIKISLVNRSTEEGIEPYLYLYEFNGTTYERMAFDYSGGNGDAYIEYEIEEAGTYYIVATTYRKQTGIYTLSVWNTPETPELPPLSSVVTFDSNGGSDVSPQTVNFNDTATQPEDPTRTGYTFEGWFEDNETFANEWNFTNTVVTDITLYAKWEEIKTGIDNIIVSSLFVSPNPATNYITISGIQTGETVRLINLNGKTVLTTNTATINVSNLPNGVYLVRVGTQTLKFVKK